MEEGMYELTRKKMISRKFCLPEGIYSQLKFMAEDFDILPEPPTAPHDDPQDLRVSEKRAFLVHGCVNKPV
jgi:hypothetical protein